MTVGINNARVISPLINNLHEVETGENLRGVAYIGDRIAQAYSLAGMGFKPVSPTDLAPKERRGVLFTIAVVVGFAPQRTCRKYPPNSSAQVKRPYRTP